MNKISVTAAAVAGLVFSFAASANAQTAVNIADNQFSPRLSTWNTRFEVAFGGVKFFLLPGEKQFIDATPSPSGSCKSTSNRSAAPIRALVFNYSKACRSEAPLAPGCPGTDTFQPRPKNTSIGVFTGYYGPGSWSVANPNPRAGGGSAFFADGAAWFDGRTWVARNGFFTGPKETLGKVLTVDWGATGTFWPSAANANSTNVNVLGAGASNLMMSNANSAQARVAQGLATALNADTQYCPAGLVDSNVVLP